MKNFLSITLTIFIFTAFYANAEDYVVVQLDKNFVLENDMIEEMTIKTGDSIQFLNADPYSHNIFSLSDLKTFDLGSFASGETKGVTFNEVGDVVIECAIHPIMYLEVKVED